LLVHHLHPGGSPAGRQRPDLLAIWRPVTALITPSSLTRVDL
jgi:hypothetical protein